MESGNGVNADNPEKSGGISAYKWSVQKYPVTINTYPEIHAHVNRLV